MSALLECRSLDAGHAGNVVVRDFSLALQPGSIVALLGPNGAGKTTILETLAGMLRPLGGEVLLDGVPLPVGQPQRVAKSGVLLVPDDRSLFTKLTVNEHLELARRKGGMTVEHALDYFPSLRNRLTLAAGNLSGGEQQMLALARGLIQEPSALLIDEMSMGLAPTIVEAMVPVLRRIAEETRAAILLVEQHIKLALEIADEAVVVVHGDTVFAGTATEATSLQGEIEHAYLAGGTERLGGGVHRALHD